MSLTKISFEIEVEGTFQNGNTLDKNSILELLAQVAEEEYDRQFEANKITRRFNFKVTNEDEETLELEAQHESVEQPRAKRKGGVPSFSVPAATLFLPK